MTDVLESLGFKVTPVIDPTREEMHKVLNNFISYIRRYPGTILFYYSGHGIQYNEKNYLIPIDAKLTYARDVKAHAINLEEYILEEVYENTSDSNIIILDACRNNPFVGQREKSVSTKGGLAEISKPPKGTIICYATAPGRVAFEGKEGEKYSVYTNSLMKYIEEGKLSIMDMLTHVRNEVYEKTDRLQVPWESNSLFKPFYFKPLSGTIHTISLDAKKSKYLKVLKLAYADGVITVEKRESLDEEIFELEITKEQAILWEKEYCKQKGLSEEIPAEERNKKQTEGNNKRKNEKEVIVRQIEYENQSSYTQKELEEKRNQYLKTLNMYYKNRIVTTSFRKKINKEKRYLKISDDLAIKWEKEFRKRIGLSEEIPEDQDGILLLEKSGWVESFVKLTRGNFNINDNSLLEYYNNIQEKYGEIDFIVFKELIEKYRKIYFEEGYQKYESYNQEKTDTEEVEFQNILNQYEKEKIKNGVKLEEERKKKELEIPKVFTNPIGMEFVLIPAGEFMMGTSLSNSDASDDEVALYKVKITNSFYMGKYPVTQKQWIDIMGNNPSKFDYDKYCPVENVSWDDTQKFIEKLNLTTFTSVPYLGVYRLPTEAEWEYAARAGSITKYYWGNVINDDYLWYSDNSNGMTHPVGEKNPNNFGLYDMLGNVWEWCEDLYDEDYYKKRHEKGIVKSQKISKSSSDRILRGGSWIFSVKFAHPSNRNYFSPASGYDSFGFRLVFVQ